MHKWIFFSNHGGHSSSLNINFILRSFIQWVQPHLNCDVIQYILAICVKHPIFSFYLAEHVSEILLWIYPGGHCVTEEYKILFQRREMMQHFNLERQHNDHAAIELLDLTCTTPPGFTLIIVQIPLNAESFSSLSLIFRREVHLTTGTTKFNIRHKKKQKTKGSQVTILESSINLLITDTLNTYMNQYTDIGFVRNTQI